jgi:hypothetical protein
LEAGMESLLIWENIFIPGRKISKRKMIFFMEDAGSKI